MTLAAEAEAEAEAVFTALGYSEEMYCVLQLSPRKDAIYNVLFHQLIPLNQ